MSIVAVNWALSARGLKPATKLVLVCLADCHNSHTKRCYPSQATLAEVCEVSRSTVNLHLNQLEKAGLIKRIIRSDTRTKKQKSTLYILGCDEILTQDVGNPVSEIRTRDSAKAVSEKQPKPCPKNSQSRVRTVGHKPEVNPKGTLPARKNPPYFTHDEKFEANQIAIHIKSGLGVNSNQITDRVKRCLIDLELIPIDVLKKNKIA